MNKNVTKNMAKQCLNPINVITRGQGEGGGEGGVVENERGAR